MKNVSLLLLNASLTALLSSCVSPPALAPVVADGITKHVRHKAEPARELTVDDLAWLAGRWVGTGFGGVCEETWNPPINGGMVGTFRLFTNTGEVNFYELMTLIKDKRGVVLRLVHFSPELSPWRNPAKPQTSG